MNHQVGYSRRNLLQALFHAAKFRGLGFDSSHDAVLGQAVVIMHSSYGALMLSYLAFPRLRSATLYVI